MRAITYKKKMTGSCLPFIQPPKKHPLLWQLQGKRFVFEKVPSKRNGHGYIHQILLANGVTLEEVTTTGMIGRTKVCKFLKRALPEKIVDEWWEAIRPAKVEVEVTCRPKDFLRMSDSRHMLTSCLHPSGECFSCVVEHIRDPDVGMIVVRDKSGQFTYRRTFRLVKDNDVVMAFFHQKQYGCFSLTPADFHYPCFYSGYFDTLTEDLRINGFFINECGFGIFPRYGVW